MQSGGPLWPKATCHHSWQAHTSIEACCLQLDWLLVQVLMPELVQPLTNSMFQPVAY